MKKRLTLICGVILIISSFTGCESSQGTSSTEKKNTEKLALTEENLKSISNDSYKVLKVNIFEESKTFDIEIKYQNDIEMGKEKEELNKIEDILKEQFDTTIEKDSIDLYYKGSTIIKRDGDKIQIRETPKFGFKNLSSGFSPYIEYKLGDKFNLLNPYKEIQVSARDQEDGDLTDKIKLQNPEVLQKEGEQKLIYEVTDSDGNTSNEELNVTVVK